MWQVRHKRNGVFMGVNHGMGHYSNISECCRALGVYQFSRTSQIESLLEMADSPHLPEHARMNREDFIVEDWNPILNEALEDEGCVETCSDFTSWVCSTFPIGLN